MATLRIYVLQRSRVVLRVPQWAVDNLEGTARITELLLKSPYLSMAGENRTFQNRYEGKGGPWTHSTSHQCSILR